MVVEAAVVLAATVVLIIVVAAVVVAFVVNSTTSNDFGELTASGGSSYCYFNCSSAGDVFSIDSKMYRDLAGNGTRKIATSGPRSSAAHSLAHSLLSPLMVVFDGDAVDTMVRIEIAAR